ncbi:MAG: amidohydrolase family protein [Frankiales bacterium]|nr:amidohydrolase family protein [Frankiales bacterium]
MDLLLTAAAVVVPDAVLRPGWVRVRGSRIAEVGHGLPHGPVRDPDGAVLDLGDAVVVAGFVDVHCHGGGGHSFGADPSESAAAAAAHLAHGTTTLVASLVTGPLDRTAREVDALAELVQQGVLAGVHLEGPWLSAARCGAHDAALLRAPAPGDVDALVGRDAVRMVTLAPELPGGLDAVRRVVGHGAVAAVGHTDADHATTAAAVAAGASHATHLFNAMRPVGHRDPGPVVALLAAEDVTLELIRDGVHLDPALTAWLDGCVAPGRLLSVTDAMAGAGLGDGRYELGGLTVVVADGVARVGGSGPIAGSVATADVGFRAAAHGPGAGAPDDTGLLRASQQASASPARVLGLDHELGQVRAGLRADLAVLDPASLRVRRVLRAGTWLA